MEPADWGAISILGAILLAILLWLQRRPGDRPKQKRPQIVVDGTNVLFWREDKAKLSTLKAVLTRLRKQGYDPVVFLDASSRHHLGDTSLSEHKFARVLDLSPDRIMVVPARTEADSFILEFAGKSKLPVVSNDRFRDRPQKARNILLLKGHFRGDQLVLKTPKGKA